MSKCIDTLLTGGEEVEIIIVDDGSKDGTAAIADSYQERYPNIVKAVHKENGGHGSGVNAGLKHATGRYFKVVDSDDWLDEKVLQNAMNVLRENQNNNDPEIDMLICNYVYNKVGEERHKIMQYRRMFPKNRVFTWDECGHIRKGHYILMHSVIFRTKMLRECKLELPEHTFYVDNIYVFNPLPYVKNMYYLDESLYYYYIGREDQSVSQNIMISRLNQQARVNKIMIDYYTDKKNRMIINRNKNCAKYMYNYLEVITAITSVLAAVSGTNENLALRQEVWQYLKKKWPMLYWKLRIGIFGQATMLPGKGGRFVTKELYRFIHHFYQFN